MSERRVICIISNQKQKNIIKNLLIVALFIILSFLSISLLLRSNMIYGTFDMHFHINRIFELVDSLKNHNYFPEYSFNQFHGSSVMTMYPYINIYPLVFLFLLIKSKITAFYVYFGIKTFLTLIISYYSSINFSKSKKTSLVFSIIYSLSMMFLSYDFIDMDLGVSTVITILPLVIFGFLDLLNDKKWLKLSFGMTWVIFGHVLSIFILGGFLILWVLINFKKINKRLINNIIKAIILSLLATSIVWIPAVNFGIHNVGNTFPPFIANLSGTSFKDLFHVGILGSLEYSLSFFALITIFISLFFYKKFSPLMKQMYILSVFIIIICSNLMPWGIFSHGILRAFGILQFTWRLYIIPQILLCYLFAVIITKDIKSSQITNVLISFSILLTIGIQLSGQNKIINRYKDAPIFNEKYVQHNTITTKRTLHHKDVEFKGVQLKYWGKLSVAFYKMNQSDNLKTLADSNLNLESPDYYPVSTIPKFNSINNNEGTTDKNKIIQIRHISYNKFLFNNNQKINELTLPLVNYNGERIHLYLNNHLIDSYNKNGLITIKNIDIGKYDIYVKHVSNKSLSLMIIILSIVGLFFYIILPFKYLFN